VRPEEAKRAKRAKKVDCMGEEPNFTTKTQSRTQKTQIFFVVESLLSICFVSFVFCFVLFVVFFSATSI
jgi:hypothetical protein